MSGTIHQRGSGLWRECDGRKRRCTSYRREQQAYDRHCFPRCLLSEHSHASMYDTLAHSNSLVSCSLWYILPDISILSSLPGSLFQLSEDDYSSAFRCFLKTPVTGRLQAML
eukprot:scaffold82398_cov56-Attheya_sp.AAC.3